MAKKTFKDLEGVLITIENDDRKRHFMRLHDKLKSVDSTGDILYMIDVEHNFDVVPVVLKESIKSWRYRTIRYSTDIDGTKSFVPGSWSSDEKEFNKKGIIDKIKSFDYKGDRSHAGRFFANEEEAKEWQSKFRDNKVFALLKEGDIVYCLSKKYTDKPIELYFEMLGIDNDGLYHIHFHNHGDIITGETVWEDKTSENTEPHFYSYRSDLGNDVKLFINEKDALKYLSDVEKRKKKSATDKYIKSIANYDGKPISFNDKKGKQLHYGDIVAYAVSGGSSYPYLSFGKITGESKTRVTVEDTQNKEEKHSVLNTCILLVKEAEVNVNSGYSFVKKK